MVDDSKAPFVRGFERLNLRLSAETFAEIDGAREVRPGIISRNTWITEAIQEKLARERLAASVQPIGKPGAHG